MAFQLSIFQEDRCNKPVLKRQVDDALLSHPEVREAVAFAAPDEKFGEAVAAVVVLNSQPADAAKAIADIKKHVSQRVAKFKVTVLGDLPRFIAHYAKDVGGLCFMCEAAGPADSPGAEIIPGHACEQRKAPGLHANGQGAPASGRVSHLCVWKYCQSTSGAHCQITRESHSA